MTEKKKYYSVLQLAEERLAAAGRDTSHIDSKFQLINEAMTASDFPQLVANVQNKVLLQGYKEYNEYWRPYTRVRPAVKDFKPISAVRLTELGNLLQVPGQALQALQFTARGEERITYNVNLWGIRVEHALDLLVNDDLGALSEITQALGRAAARTLAQQLCVIFNTNPNYDVDGVPIFDVAHANATPLAALNAANLQAAVTALLTQTDANNNPIEVSKWYLVVNPALAITAWQLWDQTGGRVAADAAPLTMLRNVGMQPPIVARGITSATGWYVIADPNDVAFMEIAFLKGLESPKYLTARGHWMESLLGQYLGPNFTTENAIVWGWGWDCTDTRGAVRGNA
jgi:hypothetical protein